MPNDNQDLRSEAVRDIIGYIPHWMIRWGITVLFSVVSALLATSWFFKYPDVISAEIVVTTENPPAIVKARTGGKMARLPVRDEDRVRKGDVLAVISSPADYDHVLEFKAKLRAFNDADSPDAFRLREDFVLGDLQSGYSGFLKLLADYRLFIRLDHHNRNIADIREQMGKHEILFKRALRQRELMRRQFELSKKRYARYSRRENRQFIARQEIENMEKSILQQMHSMEGVANNLDNMRMKMADLKKSIRETELEKIEQVKHFELNIKESVENLLAGVISWEHTHVLTAPVDGTVSLTKYWSINQNVAAGDGVMTVVMNDVSKLMGRVKLQMAGAGKVKPGQEVNVEFANYPHEEYGTVKGVVRGISPVPEDGYYTAEVDLPAGLMSNYGRRLLFKPEMHGTAKIVTEDIRVLERMLAPVKSMLKSKVADTTSPLKVEK